MDRRLKYTSLLVVVITAVSILAAGCVYYNMFFNAKKKFDLADQQSKTPTGRRTTGRFGAGYRTYEEAIENARDRVQEELDGYDDAEFNFDSYADNRPLVAAYYADYLFA